MTVAQPLIEQAVSAAETVMTGWNVPAREEVPADVSNALWKLGRLLVSLMQCPDYEVDVQVFDSRLVGIELDPARHGLEPMVLRTHLPTARVLDLEGHGVWGLNALFDDGMGPTPYDFLDGARLRRIMPCLLVYLLKSAEWQARTEDYNWGPADDTDDESWKDFPDERHPEALVERLRRLHAVLFPTGIRSDASS